MNWDHYRYFFEIHRSGTLKAAAEKLGVNQTTVGRNLSGLEKEIGTRLFQRRSDGFILTAAGERILGAIQRTEETFHDVERILAGKDDRVEGVVKITAPGALVNHWLIPRLAPFTKKYPAMELQFKTGPEVLNLARRDADIALRLVRPSQKGLMVRRLGMVTLGLFAHRKLFSLSRLPETPAELKHFPFAGLYPEAVSAQERELLDLIGEPQSVAIRTAAWSSVLTAISGKIGIGILPTFMVEENSSLVRVLPELGTHGPLWCVYHPDLRNAARIRAVLDYLDSIFRTHR